jgi:hypothetical protein
MLVIHTKSWDYYIHKTRMEVDNVEMEALCNNWRWSHCINFNNWHRYPLLQETETIGSPFRCIAELLTVKSFNGIAVC